MLASHESWVEMLSYRIRVVDSATSVVVVSLSVVVVALAVVVLVSAVIAGAVELLVSVEGG